MNRDLKFKKLLEKVQEKIKLPEKEQQKIEKKLDNFIKKLKKIIKKADIVVGGSFAKGTLLKKEIYDIDVFVVFPKSKKKKQDISIELENMLKKARIKAEKLKGSRDYFQVNLAKNLTVELIPILKIKKPDEAENITDVSLFHVTYILKKKKNEKFPDEVRLAKAFCYASDCYGAESYVKGFSGYSLEILVCYYKSFLNFIKAASKWKDKEIIDPEKHYKNEQEILEKLNYAKLISPLILIDPVQASRNVTAALSEETFERFVKNCKNFLAKPSEKFFFKQQQDIGEWKKQAKKKKAKFFILQAISNSKKKDIAGAKLKKFFDFLIKHAEKEGFIFLKKHFDFEEQILTAHYLFIIKEPPREVTICGPPLNADNQFLEAFKKKWQETFIKNSRLCVKTKRKIVKFEQFLESIPKKQLEDMKIKSIIVKD